MGSSGLLTATGPQHFRVACPILPLIALGATFTTTVAWPAALPADSYTVCIAQDAIIGRALAQVTGQSSTGITIKITASVLLAAGAQIVILAWM